MLTTVGASSTPQAGWGSASWVGQVTKGALAIPGGPPPFAAGGETSYLSDSTREGNVAIPAPGTATLTFSGPDGGAVQFTGKSWGSPLPSGDFRVDVTCSDGLGISDWPCQVSWSGLTETGVVVTVIEAAGIWSSAVLARGPDGHAEFTPGGHQQWAVAVAPFVGSNSCSCASLMSVGTSTILRST